MQSQGIISLISSIRDRANELIGDLLAKRGITGVVASHGSIFVSLFQEGPLSMSELAVKIGKKKNTVTVLVEKLTREGYVRVRKSPSDGRVTIVELTEKGEGFRGDFEEISRVLLERVWGEMPLEERESLVAKLRVLAGNLAHR
ncbi:hypothetical protein GMSM_27450 [Geomonas sp. Red276]